MNRTRREVISTIGISAAGATAAVMTTSCGGGSSTSTGPTPEIEAPQNLSYSSPLSGTVGVSLSPLIPSVSGSVTSYSVSPSLPLGLTLDPASGQITGTPNAASAQSSYTITASNSAGSTTFALTITINGVIVLKSSTVNPTALTPVALDVTGLDFTTSFTVQLTNSSGYSATLAPVRTDSTKGVVVVAAPLYIDPTTGITGPLSASVQINQGSLTSNAIAWTIADLPSVASYGVNPGDISRGFLNAQSLYFGMAVNALQAMTALPAHKTDSSTLQAHLQTQQISTTEARANVDLIVSGSQTSLSVGTLTSGTAVNFNSTSVDVQDRVLGLYLQAVGYLPSTIYSSSPSAQIRSSLRKTKRHRHNIASPSVFFSRSVSQTRPRIDSETPRIKPSPSRAYSKLEPRQLTAQQLINTLSTAGAAVNLTNAGVQEVASNSTFWDRWIAVGQGLSSTVLAVDALGIVAVGPELLAAAAITGLIYSVAAVGNDVYKIATAQNAVEQSNAGLSLASDLFALTLAPLGIPSKAAGTLGFGSTVVQVLEDAASGAPGVTVQGLSLISGMIGLGLTLNGAEYSSDAQTSENANAEMPTLMSDLGLVEGNVSVTNANGPILAPLDGVLVVEPNTSTQFTTLAGEDGNYNLIVPLNVPGYNYSNMSLEPYDPVADATTGSPVVIDLAGLIAGVPYDASPISGTCIDTDASDPDEDDPDCDNT